MAPKHCATMYIMARTSDTFLAKNSPNVTAGNAGSAVNKNKDHSTKGPSNAKNANTAAGISAIHMRVCLALVSDHCENSDVQEQKSGNKLGYDGPVKRPLTQLLWVNEGCWWRVLVVLYRVLIANLNVFSHFNSTTETNQG
nr:hypothetical protein KK1_022158 [Ipomoea batatas]